MQTREVAAPQSLSFEPAALPRIYPLEGPTPRRALPPPRSPGGDSSLIMSEPLALPGALRQLLERPGPFAMVLHLPPEADLERLGQALVASFPGRSVLLGWEEGEGSAPFVATRVGSSLPPTSLDQAARIRNAWGRLVRGPLSGQEELSDFLWLPGALQEAWSRLGPDPEPAMLVVRHWERWMKEYLGDPHQPLPGMPDHDRLLLLLLRQMARRAAHLVFLEDTDGGGSLEDAVDAVVSLGSDLSSGRLERLQRRSASRPTPFHVPAPSARSTDRPAPRHR